MKNLIFEDWGIINYKDALIRQKYIFDNILELKKKVISQNVHNYIIFCEHNHVYTIGTNGNINNILIDKNFLKKHKIQFYIINRGGDITYHGPGQLVCYLIIDLKFFNLNIHEYIRMIEDNVILTLKSYNLISYKINNITGVWVSNNYKICFIGVYCRKWITMHGFSININNNIQYFNNIIPCGINNIKITSLSNEKKYFVNMTIFKNILKKNLYQYFSQLNNA